MNADGMEERMLEDTVLANEIPLRVMTLTVADLKKEIRIDT